MKSWIRQFVAASVALWACVANAVPLTGDVNIYDPGGGLIFNGPITGDLDLAGGTMSVDPFLFFGQQLVTDSVELLGPGTHTRTDPNGVSLTTTVGPDQLGGYVEINWNNNRFGTLMVWDVTPSSDGGAYTTVDSDGDGIPGQILVSGPFVGVSITYDFVSGEPPPGIGVSIDVSGGSTQECNTSGGSNVTINADIDLVGGAVLGSIDWSIDGAAAGSGPTIMPFLALGVHTVDVTATTTTGESGSDSAIVTVQDTTDPELEVAFLDNAGNVITSASPGSYVTVRIAPDDVCDPAPVSEGSVVPVYAVKDGDAIKLQSGKVSTAELPISAIELTGITTDASGNSASGNAVLTITD